MIENKYIIQIVVGCFILFFYIFIDYDPKALFFIIIIIIVYYILTKTSKVKLEKLNKNIEKFLDNKEQTICDIKTWIESEVFPIYKTPNKLYYIKKNPEIIQIIYNLKDVNTYDHELMNQIIIRIEAFLKLHYKLMTDKTGLDYNVSILHDLRKELMKHCNLIIFAIPEIIPRYRKDLKKTIEIEIQKLKSLTFKYMRMVYHKYNLEYSHYDGKGPRSFDEKDNKYEVDL